MPQRLGVAALLVPLVPRARDFLQTTAGGRRRRAARRGPRGVVAVEQRGRVNASPRGSRSTTAHDAAVAVVAGAGSEHDWASARRLRGGRCRPRDAAGRADVACGERIGERRAGGAPAPAPAPAPAASPSSSDAAGAAAGAGENERARSGAAVARRARRIGGLRRQLARVAPPSSPPHGRIARRRRLGGAGGGGRGRGRGCCRAQAQRRDRRTEIREDVGFPVRLVPGAGVVQRERGGAEAHPVTVGLCHHRR